MEHARSSSRWVGILGIAWVVIFLVSVGGLQGEPPASDASVDDVRAFFAENSTRYLLGDYLAGISFMLVFVPFAALLPRGLGIASSAWSRMALAAAVALVAVGGTATSFLDAVAIAKGDPAIDDSALTTLVAANAAGIALIGLPAALLTVSLAGMLLDAARSRAGVDVIGRAPALRRHPLIAVTVVLCWIASALLVIGAAFPLEGGAHGLLWIARFSGFIGLALVVVLSSVVMLRTRRAVVAA